jgi:proline-specific peptidase
MDLATTKEGYIPFHGYKTWYKIVGIDNNVDRFPLICIHGGPGVPHDYLKSLEAIANTGRQVIFYDQLGCGNSDKPNDNELWTVELFKNELTSLLKELKIVRYHLLGQSWGGMLALEHVLDKPIGLKSLILASTTASMPQWIAETRRLRNEAPRQL